MFDFIKNMFRSKNSMEQREEKETKTSIKELEYLILDRLQSKEYKDMVLGDKYYSGQHDILERKKYSIGENNELVELHNVPNYKIVDNQFKNILDQKVNYILSKPLTISTDNEMYLKELNYMFDDKMLNTLYLLGKDAYKYGISWLYVYYDDKGELEYKIFDAKEVVPIWKDDDHNELDYLIRIYNHKYFDKNGYKTKTNVEVYNMLGVDYYEFNNNKLTPNGESKPYIKFKGRNYNWDRIPIIPFKCNESETPLINNCKIIQDNINEIISDYRNSLETNFMNNIFVVKGYNSEGDKFRYNVNKYGVINLSGDHADVKLLTPEFNSSNYSNMYELLKKSLIENAKGFDAKSDVLRGNPNQMNIQSMYSDIDLDANTIEREFQKSLEHLAWFIDNHLLLVKKGDFRNDKLDFIFNRDILINESQAIDDCIKSMNVLSRDTILSQHPWVTDIDIEKQRLEKEEKKANNSNFYYTEYYKPYKEEHDHEETEDLGIIENEKD